MSEILFTNLILVLSALMQFEHCTARLVKVETVQGQLWDQLRIRARVPYEGMPSADRFPPDEQVPRTPSTECTPAAAVSRCYVVTRCVERPRGGGADFRRGRGRRWRTASGVIVCELSFGFQRGPRIAVVRIGSRV